ncbi:hypothetical protein JZ751_008357, partial [Albula glossodonta]
MIEEVKKLGQPGVADLHLVKAVQFRVSAVSLVKAVHFRVTVPGLYLSAVSLVKAVQFRVIVPGLYLSAVSLRCEQVPEVRVSEATAGQVLLGSDGGQVPGYTNRVHADLIIVRDIGSMNLTVNLQCRKDNILCRSPIHSLCDRRTILSSEWHGFSDTRSALGTHERAWVRRVIHDFTGPAHFHSSSQATSLTSVGSVVSWFGMDNKQKDAAEGLYTPAAEPATADAETIKITRDVIKAYMEGILCQVDNSDDIQSLRSVAIPTRNFGNSDTLPCAPDLGADGAIWKDFAVPGNSVISKDT